jgi:drug/metabolite transporter (DMT)-like permease
MPLSQTRAVAYGIAAIVLWSTMASLIALAGPIPPFQLAAITFAIGSVCGLAGLRLTRQPVAMAFSAPPGAILLGLAGLLGYHVLYFYALQTAPALEANVINYLWPLLIVMFSALLPAVAGGKRLTWSHVLGALTGFAGALIGLGSSAGETGVIDVVHTALENAGPGHLAALGAAITWAAYSVASRLFKGVPSASVVGNCVLTAIGAAAIHSAVETTAWPLTGFQWSLVIAMGVGPAGIAFTLWDQAVKHGDIRVIGVVSYATPLLSSGLLTALGFGHADPLMGLAVLLVTLGAVLAGRDTFRLPSTRRVG